MCYYRETSNSGHRSGSAQLHRGRFYKIKERTMGIIGWLIFGAIVGWIASKIMGTDAQQGALLNIIVGIVGALLGGFLWGLLTGDTEPYRFFSIGSWITAIVGACILVFIVGAISGRRRI